MSLLYMECSLSKMHTNNWVKHFCLCIILYVMLACHVQTVRHLFVPAEKRIPKIRIETRQAATLCNQRIVVAIDSWPRNSRYPQVMWVVFYVTILKRRRYIWITLSVP